VPDLTQDEVELLMNKIHVISLDEYKRGGNMRVLLRHCTATLIMYHPDYVADHDVHFMLPSKLINAIKNCGFATDDTTASQKLHKWSDLIRDRFVTVNK
jgi:hypothetical protein